MTMHTSNMLFINRQINQIREGGVHALHRKIGRLLWLLFMNISAPLVARLKMDWPKAYLFLGRKNLKKLKNLNAQENFNEAKIKKTIDQAIIYFKTIVDCDLTSVDEQDWIAASRALGRMYFMQGKMGKANDLFQKEADVLREITKGNQFDELEIEFLPEFLAVASIGTYEFLDAHVKSGILGLRPSKKLILLIDPKATVNNLCYLNYWRRYVTIISDPTLVQMLSPLQRRFGLSLNSYMLLNGKARKGILALGAVREQWINAKRSPILTLSNEDSNRGRQCLKSFGMQQDDWFVCLHVRERGWKDNNSPAEDFRNADIYTYISAIKAITDTGGWVIRMGDSTMEPLPEMPRVIDYAHSDAKSDWMDVFLCAQCQFFVGTSSGLFIFAMGFGIPVVATNFLPTCCAYYLTSNDLFIPRICKLKEKDRFISFSELFSPFLGTAAIQKRYDREGIEVIENTEEEIKNLVEEMLERYDETSNDSESEEDRMLQKRFRGMTADCGKLYGDLGLVSNARIGRRFLRKYAELLPSGEKKKILVNSIVEKQ